MPFLQKQLSPLRLKIGTLFLACFLWLYVALNGTYTDEIECKVVPINLQYGKTLASQLPETVTLNITGSGVDLLRLNLFWKSGLNFNLDLQTITSYYDFPLNKNLSWVSVPRGFENEIAVNSIVYPDNIIVELDNLDSLFLPVNEDSVLITVKEGYAKVGNIKFLPDSIMVKGPRRIVRGLYEIPTAMRSFENKSKDFTESIRLETLHKSVITYSYNEVTMSVDIQKIGEKIINNVPVNIVRKPAAYSVEFKPSTLTITITGGVDYIKDLNAEDFTPLVIFDRTWVRGGEYFANIDIDWPEFAIDYELSPQNITVVVR